MSMLQVKHCTMPEDLANAVNSLWQQEQCMDCRLWCLDGAVLCSKLVLAAHSPLLADILRSSKVGEVLLLDYSKETVQWLMALLHGGKERAPGCEGELEELIADMGIVLSDRLLFGIKENKSARTEKAVVGEEECHKHSYNKEMLLQASSIRQSSRSTRGQHRRFGTSRRGCGPLFSGETDPLEDTTPAPPSEEEPCQIALALEPFVKEDEEMLTRSAASNVAIEGQSRKRPLPTSEDNCSDPDDPLPIVERKTSKAAAEPELVFVTPDQLTELTRTHIVRQSIRGGAFKCTECSLGRTDKSLLEQHVGVQHLRVSTIQCLVCGWVAPAEDSMEQHLNARHGLTREEEKAAEGSYRLITKSECTLNILQEPFKAFPCEFCSKMMKNSTEAAHHQAGCGGGQKNVWYTIVSSSRYQCLKCDSVLHNKTAIKAHLAYTHQETLPFVCEHCADSFLTAAMLDYHLRNSHMRKKKPATIMIGNYHLRQYPTYLPPSEAEPIIASYYEGLTVAHTTLGKWRCRVCNQRFADEAVVRDHLLTGHLRLLLHQCAACGTRTATKQELHNCAACHLKAAKQVELVESSVDQSRPDPAQYGAVPSPEIGEESEDMTVVLVDEEEQKFSAGEEEAAAGRPSSEAATAAGAATAAAVSRSMYRSKEKLERMARGRLCTQLEAETLVKENLCKSILGRTYECLVCNKEWKSKKLEMAKDHIYDHFNIFPYQCDKCQDLFRRRIQLERHAAIHARRAARSQLAGEDELVGRYRYHLAEEASYLPWREAKSVLAAYLSKQEGGQMSCKLCQYSSHELKQCRLHLLQFHLKLNIWRCDQCGQELKLEVDIRNHLRDKHGTDFEGLDRVDDPDYDSKETDFPEVEDVTSLPADQLWGHKVSSAQGRQLRKLHIQWSEAAKRYECGLCRFAKESSSQCADHIMAAHFNVFMYRCPVKTCKKLLRNWSRYTQHRSTHERVRRKPDPVRRRKPFNVGRPSLDLEYHLITQEVYVGKEEGLRIAREYSYYVADSGQYQCKLCPYTSRAQAVEGHVLAKHLTKLYLYRCETCGKMVRYSEAAYKNHLQLHQTGKLTCHLCHQLDQATDKSFTKESLAAHHRRMHAKGSYPCKVQGCSLEMSTLAELRVHERQDHFLGLSRKKFQYMCQMCEHTFPKRQQLEGHMQSCQAGRSRSRFRKLIADCLTWEGGGVYTCNFCQERFVPTRPTASSLPAARKHMVSVHKQTHLRKTKMSWTQGVQGMNEEKKAARRQRDGNLLVESGTEGVLQEEVGEVLIQYIVPDDTVEVVIADMSS